MKTKLLTWRVKKLKGKNKHRKRLSVAEKKYKNRERMRRMRLDPAYRAKERKCVLEYWWIHHAKNLAKQRAYCRINKDRINKCRKAWSAKNAEYVRLYWHFYRQDHEAERTQRRRTKNNTNRFFKNLAATNGLRQCAAIMQ